MFLLLIVEARCGASGNLVGSRASDLEGVISCCLEARSLDSSSCAYVSPFVVIGQILHLLRATFALNLSGPVDLKQVSLVSLRSCKRCSSHCFLWVFAFALEEADLGLVCSSSSVDHCRAVIEIASVDSLSS